MFMQDKCWLHDRLTTDMSFPFVLSSIVKDRRCLSSALIYVLMHACILVFKNGIRIDVFWDSNDMDHTDAFW